MSNLTVQAPLEEPARQEYFMEMAKKQVAQLSRELGRPLTCCINTFAYLFHQNIQMTTARMAVAKGTLDDDLRLTQILFLPTGSDPERIQLRS